MTILQLLVKDKWITNMMIRCGVLSFKYSNAIKMYTTYQEYKELNKCTKNAAAVFTAKYYRVSRQTVWNIINELETDI